MATQPEGISGFCPGDEPGMLVESSRCLILILIIQVTSPISTQNNIVTGIFTFPRIFLVVPILGWVDPGAKVNFICSICPDAVMIPDTLAPGQEKISYANLTLIDASSFQV